MMPGIDGYETCLKLRSHPTLQYTKIITVSAKALLTERMQGYDRLSQMKSAVIILLQYAICLSPMDSQIIVHLRKMGGTFILTVTDEGEGLDPDLLLHIFDEFIPVNMTLPTDGQGLSLAIAQQIVFAHRGNIQVESTKGEGTTFRVLLPVT